MSTKEALARVASKNRDLAGKRREPMGRDDMKCTICGSKIESQDISDLAQIRFRQPLCKQHFTEMKEGKITEAVSTAARKQWRASFELGPKAALIDKAQEAEAAEAQLAAERERIKETGRFFG